MADHERMLLETTVEASRARVWSALRDPQQVRQWFGWDYPGLAAEIEEIFFGTVEADEATGTLSWPEGDRLELHDLGEQRTDVRVVRQGHVGVEEFDGAFDAIDEGWITFAQQLRFYLERHDGRTRRTVSAHGVDLGPEDDALLARLGLRSLGDDPVGGSYEVQRPDGTTFSGEVFFQTDLQVGLTVAEESDALLVVARTPPTSAPPHGEVMFLLSTYGLDDAGFEDVEQRWTRWWSAG